MQEVSGCGSRNESMALVFGRQQLLSLTQASGGRGDWHGAEQASRQTIGTGSKEGKGFSPGGRLANSLGL